MAVWRSCAIVGLLMSLQGVQSFSVLGLSKQGARADCVSRSGTWNRHVCFRLERCSGRCVGNSIMMSADPNDTFSVFKTTMQVAAVSAALFLPLVFTDPVFSAETERSGKVLFKMQCVQCHAGGGNVINPAQSLDQSALTRNGVFSKAGIIDVIINGKKPLFTSMGHVKSAGITDEEIKRIADYILEQAATGWKAE